MGFFDKAKRLLGLSDSGDAPEPPPAAAEPAPRGGRSPRGRDRKDRPPLVDPPPGSTQTVDDALEAREAGDRAGARKILAEIDRGQGLRTVLRAAAALEDGDEGEVRELLPAVATEAEGHRLLLQLGAALGDPRAAAPYLDRAAAAGAPAWALAWTRATSSDEAARREGLVELLFTDAPLARTVAARDLHLEGVEADPGAATTYAAFAHGRDSIRRFGPEAVARLVDRALGGRA